MLCYGIPLEIRTWGPLEAHFIKLTSSLKEFTNHMEALGGLRNQVITSVLHDCYVIDDLV